MCMEDVYRWGVLCQEQCSRAETSNYIPQILWGVITLSACDTCFWHNTPHTALQWRHHERDDVSNHQPHDCLLNRLSRRRSKKTSKLRVTGLCAGTSPVTGEFPAQRASNVENVSIWWRHHGICMVPFAWVMYVLNMSQQVFKDRYINMCGIWHIWTTVPFDELQAVNQCFWQTTTAPILDKITAVRHTSQRIQHIDVGWK